jgi:hypothetical protein
MLPAPMESWRDHFETIGAGGGETSNSMQSAQRQTALVERWPFEEVEQVRVRVCNARCRGKRLSLLQGIRISGGGPLRRQGR